MEEEYDIQLISCDQSGENWQAWDLAHLILALVGI